MIWFYNLESIFNHKQCPIIVCLESAASKLRLCTYPPSPLIYYTDASAISTQYKRVIKVNDLDTNNCILINGVYCTNPERTIYEMIKMDRDEFFILESIINYEYKYDINTLREYFKNKSDLNLFEYWHNESKDYEI